MRVHSVEVKRYRGLRQLCVALGGRLHCFVGPGDAGKSTVLRSIEAALSPRRDLSFSDVDYHDLDVDSGLEITVTVIEPPEDLLLETKFGLFQRAVHNGKLIDEPEAGKPALSVKLRVDSSLEPEWVVWTERNEKRISAFDRAKFRVQRVGPNVTGQLTWARGSTLSAATTEADEATPFLAAMLRETRQTLSGTALPALSTTSKNVEHQARRLGVKPHESFGPGLNPYAISIRQGAMSLHDGALPLSQRGLGAQRLTALATQMLSAAKGSILLLDEVEHALEPHRLRNIVRFFRDRGGHGQALLATHSPVCVEELNAGELIVIHARGSESRSAKVPDELQDVVRAAPEALLGQRIVVCEGKTEVGLLRALDHHLWSQESAASQTPDEQNEEWAEESFPLLGVVPVDGGGESAASRALKLKRLGYSVALFRDTDKPLKVAEAKGVSEAKIPLFEWSDSCHTEGRLFLDASPDLVRSLLELAIVERGDGIIDSVHSRCHDKPGDHPLAKKNLDSLLAESEDSTLRESAGAAAHKNGWFKTQSNGERVGSLLASFLSTDPDCPLAKTLKSLRSWAYAGH